MVCLLYCLVSRYIYAEPGIPPAAAVVGSNSDMITPQRAGYLQRLQGLA